MLHLPQGKKEKQPLQRCWGIPEGLCSLQKPNLNSYKSASLNCTFDKEPYLAIVSFLLFYQYPSSLKGSVLQSFTPYSLTYQSQSTSNG